MKAFSARPGFALPVVLFIAVLGILLGIGRLMTFSSQCKIRLDRQQEYEKVLAVRSALNGLQNFTTIMPAFPAEGGADGLIALHTDSGRDVKVLVRPAEAIFPRVNDTDHFCVNWKTSDMTTPYSRIDGSKYRYASSVNGNVALERNLSDVLHSISLMPANANPGDICRLSMDMSGTGRWSDDAFGRRYMFNIAALPNIGNGGSNDIVRLILRRKRHSEDFNGPGGGVHRTLQPNESMIFAELRTGGGTEGSFEAWTQRGSEAPVLCVPYKGGVTAQNTFGIQLVGRRLALFYSFASGDFKQYDLLETGEIPESVYYDFTNNVVTTLSADMVMELEIEASPARLAQGGIQSGDMGKDRFCNLEVYPAFEFSLLLENKNERDDPEIQSEAKLATVVHLDIKGQSTKRTCTAISYDTHGTEIKGWRTGERMAWGLIK